MMNDHHIIKVTTHEDANILIDDIMKKSRWRNIGIVSYNIPLLSTHTVVDNIMLPIIYHKRMNVPSAEQLVMDLLNKFALQDIAYLRPKALNQHQILITKYLRAIISYPLMVVFVLPHEMLPIEIYELFIDFLSSITDFNITIVEHETFVENFYSNTNYTEIEYDTWLTHVLNTSK